MNKYKLFLLKREKNEKEISFKISSQTLVKLKKITPAVIRQFPTIKKIIIFGSMANRSMNDFSDVDVFVDSIEPSKYWELLSFLSKKLQRDVDIITPDDDPYLQDIIFQNGVVIYERKD